MTEKTTVKSTTKKKTDAVIKIDGEPAKKSNKLPAAVAGLANELKIEADQLLGWNVYPDRVVIISMNGMKFTKSLSKESDQ